MSSFTFKQFHINQQHCAMKVGTDSILLGAWADIEQAKNVLDMGCGTGLLALMLAQRSSPDCSISAVELDPAAAQQARENIAISPWQERINLIHADVQHFLHTTSETFDLIVANPPYFKQGVECKNEERELARYTKQSHLNWLVWAAERLSEKGKISFVLPYEAAKTLEKLTALYCIKQTEIITKIGKSPQRMLITFSKQPQKLLRDQIVIYNEKNCYTGEFVELTKDFYLKF
ncbi:tRNA1(Val) (adenine(37)-N6)-methyltransferase [Rodentibacter pneumotropicus]|uniref:tRNA1(Val) (adenine(37)-N6)-methyltransferase n=1 Tax=Rodentibacter pneumotropicus TaxID=758 RepID=UPI0003680A16|nr:tRNA1(Val) (adenine(37)-N6)-methyltransferase [Rodentibacter pneumotropicus]NBH75189.1 tRNA1(Val) (adenine(37)-N6)-methyltransferase [Rodentibacter pneumotropicus]OOF60620.1 tRNA (adenosine(37)-N6)-methyltransferase TrmM [Rodentibacter pneumotropicus]THA02843.1 tRNA1(Val) (adenine(37)-N6)-methyltransferase [Rodentibacter pneumotropicus]THA08052.1 tRNA1(Val) (adenine(37)-N6)-methyltransferase [Rodentibacter pneumotropicus]THA13212.1 tRNA1(Val) (adenine(37)-N6)-methyltransferase [Rodentibacte